MAELALGVTLLLALFGVLLGTRNLDATEHHRGMVVAIAFESVVKLLAFMAVGGFALWLIIAQTERGAYPGGGRLPRCGGGGDAGQSAGARHFHTLIAMCAVICLPRQFHVTVVENDRGRNLHWARWIFPLYLFLMGLFIWPLALAGKQSVRAALASDTYVISLPMSLGYDGMAMLAFLGGTSAATGMVIVCTIALAIMVSNDLVLPVLLRRVWQQGRDERLMRLLLQVRRGAILLILLAAWALYLWLGDLTSLSRIGYLSFGAVAQFAPALLLGLYWRHGNRKGVYLGLALGVSLWFVTLLAESGLLAGSPLEALLAPPDWPAVRDLEPGGLVPLPESSAQPRRLCGGLPAVTGGGERAAAGSQLRRQDEPGYLGALSCAGLGEGAGDAGGPLRRFQPRQAGLRPLRRRAGRHPGAPDAGLRRAHRPHGATAGRGIRYLVPPAWCWPPPCRDATCSSRRSPP